MDALDTAERGGQIFGVGVVFMLGLMGMAACAKRLRQPDYSKNCLRAFALFMMVWILGAAWRGLPLIGLSKQEHLLWFILPTLAGVIASTVLAILGLVHMHGRPPEARLLGRGFGIWTLVFCGIMYAAMGFGLVQAGTKTRMPRAESQPGRDQELRFENENLLLKAPGHPWVRMDPRKIMPLASALLATSEPETYFAVIAERRPFGNSLDTAALAELAKTRLQSNSIHCRFRNDGPETVAGLDGLAFEAEVRMGDLDLAYKFWVCSGVEHLYQIVMWSGAAEADKLRSAFFSLRPRLSLLRDPKPPPAPPSPEEPPVRVEDLNLSFRTPPKPWIRMNAAVFHPDAYITLHHAPLDATFLLIAEKTAGAPSEIRQRVAELLRARVRSLADDAEIGSTAERKIDGLEGLGFEARTTEGDDTIWYRVWIHARPGFAYQLMLYGPAERSGDLTREAEQVFRRFNVLDRTSDESPEEY